MATRKGTWLKGLSRTGNQFSSSLVKSEKEKKKTTLALKTSCKKCTSQYWSLQTFVKMYWNPVKGGYFLIFGTVYVYLIGIWCPKSGNHLEIIFVNIVNSFKKLNIQKFLLWYACYTSKIADNWQLKMQRTSVITVYRYIFLYSENNLY